MIIIIIIIICIIIIISYFIYSCRIYNYYFEHELLDYSKRLWISRYNNSFQNYTTHSLFSVVVYVSSLEPVSCFMIFINPQRLYFFIERGNIIYHPNDERNDALLKQYAACEPSDEFELAYVITNVTKPKVICHRKLSYLKKNIYTNKVYSYNYNKFQNPLVVIWDVFNRLIKTNNIKKYIYV